MYSLQRMRTQVDALQRRLKPALAILRLRSLAMQFCDEFDEATLREDPPRRDTLLSICQLFPPRVRDAGFRLDTYMDLVRYCVRCLDARAHPEPREMVFTLLPWARRGPHLRPDLWERPTPA